MLIKLKLTSAGRLFQALTTLSQKKVPRIPALCGLKTLYLCPLVWGTELSVKKLVGININKPENDRVTPHEVG